LSVFHIQAIKALLRVIYLYEMRRQALACCSLVLAWIGNSNSRSN
jgi:hypothetical protein